MRIFEDPPPILGGDLPLLCDPVGQATRKIGLSPALGRYADFTAGDEIDALRFEGPMVDPDFEAGAEEVLVGDLGPPLAPFQQFCAGVPFTLLFTEAFGG
jgi:hypothetical protein